LATPAWNDRYYRSADGLRLHYRDYPAGAAGRLPVLCLPGLTRNARDFDALAPHLQRARRVLCVDLRGRGRSQHDPHWQNYHPGTYLADLVLLLADAGIERCVFLGTSLGGLLTMLMAASRPACVSAAILNDIGPEVDPAGLARIAAYVGRQPVAKTWAEATQLVRSTHGAALPGLTDEQWSAYTRRT
jgi:pimeloyl-ACP methyl ester carboxylesterase